MKLTAFLLFSVYTSCLVPDPKTHIVMMTEQGGCADTAHSSLESIQTCFRAHKELARQIAPECKYQVQHTPNAHWGDSTEGRICKVAIPVAAWSTLYEFKATN
jgi:hypothetical protein